MKITSYLLKSQSNTISFWVCFFNGDTQFNAIVLEKYIQKLFSHTGLVAELYVYLFIRKTLEMVVRKSSPGSGHVSEGSMESSLKLKCATL